MTKTCAFAALTLAALAGTAFANPDGDMPATLPGVIVRGLQPAEYPPARQLPEVIQAVCDNATGSFSTAGLTAAILGTGAVSTLEDLNFNPGPWGSSFAGPRLATSMTGFAFQLSGTTVATDVDVVFDFYNGSAVNFARVYTAGALPTDPPVSPGMLADNSAAGALARLTFQIRALAPGAQYLFNGINLTGLPGGGISFGESSAAVRTRFVRAGLDPQMPSNWMFTPITGTLPPPGGVNPTANPAGQPATTQIVFPRYQNNFQVGSTALDYGRDLSLDGFFGGAAVAANGGGVERRFVVASPTLGFAIGLAGDVPPPPPPAVFTDLGTVDCSTSSPAAQTVNVTPAIADPATPGSVRWFKMTLPSDASVAGNSFFNIIAADTNAFGIDPAMALYTDIGGVVKIDNNSGGGFVGTDSLLTFGIGNFAPVNGSHDLDGNDGDLAAGVYYLGIAAGGTGFGPGFNVNTSTGINGSAGDVTLTISHNLSASGNCVLPDAVAPTIAGALAVGLLPHGTVTSVTTTAGSENITWLSFENDVDISDADPSKFLDIDVLGSTFFVDSELGVFDSAGNNVTIDDDSGPGAFSQISFQGAGGPQRPAAGDGLPYAGQDGPLAVGTYYLAVGLFDVVFQATRWGARSDSGSNGTVVVNFRTSSDCVADFNADGVVNPDDLADFIGGFFSVPPNPACDFNHDGIVDPDDLADFIGAFFSSPASCAG